MFCLRKPLFWIHAMVLVGQNPNLWNDWSQNDYVKSDSPRKLYFMLSPLQLWGEKWVVLCLFSNCPIYIITMTWNILLIYLDFALVYNHCLMSTHLVSSLKGLLKWPQIGWGVPSSHASPNMYLLNPAEWCVALLLQTAVSWLITGPLQRCLHRSPVNI